MPKKHKIPAPVVLDYGRDCPFRWCTASHVDDWAANRVGDPVRSHWASLSEVMDDGLWDPADVIFNLEETRGCSGVSYSPLTVQLGESTELPAADFLRALRLVKPAVDRWIDAVDADVDLLRSPEHQWQRD